MEINELTGLIETLRSENGCPWDRKQTPGSVCLYLIEEAYELMDAVTSEDDDAVREELGDVLFQILFIEVLYREKHKFILSDVIETINEKMVRRHPHVFGDEKVESAQEVIRNWRRIKAGEKDENVSVPDSVPRGMPVLMRAPRVYERARGAGFEPAEKENLKETFEAFLTKMEDPGKDEEDEKTVSGLFGDLLFHLIRKGCGAGLHPETALTDAVNRFEKDFRCWEKTGIKTR